MSFVYLLPKNITTYYRRSYLDSEDANSVSFDSDGFYKTGDLVRRVLDDYVLEGRAATDCKSIPFFYLGAAASDVADNIYNNFQ